MLGIVIGVGAVIVIMAVGAGAQSLILGQVKSLGTGIIGVMPGGSAGEEGPPASMMGISITTLTYDDAMALKEKKKSFELKQSQLLQKHLTTQIGDDYSPQLAAYLISEIWGPASQDQKRKWLKAAKLFRLSSCRHITKENQKNSATNQPEREKEI